MNIEAIKNTILISDFLQREGFSPVRQSGGQVAFKAPYREDGDPSLVVNDRKGVWYDHGEGAGGKIIDLALKLYNTKSVEYAVDRINKLYSNIPLDKIPTRAESKTSDGRKSHEITTIKPLGSNFAITAYLESRGVFEEAVNSKQVVEIYYDHIKDGGDRKRYFGAAWKNDAGGYDIRSKYGKICINTKDMLVMTGNSGKTNVFEGMINFLSALKEQTILMKDTNIVMNSLSLSMRAIEKIKADRPSELNLFLDNGAGGDKFTQIFKDNFPLLNDKRTIYAKYEDYNDKLMDEMQKKTLSYSR